MYSKLWRSYREQRICHLQSVLEKWQPDNHCLAVERLWSERTNIISSLLFFFTDSVSIKKSLTKCRTMNYNYKMGRMQEFIPTSGQVNPILTGLFECIFWGEGVVNLTPFRCRLWKVRSLHADVDKYIRREEYRRAFFHEDARSNFPQLVFYS